MRNHSEIYSSPSKNYFILDSPKNKVSHQPPSNQNHLHPQQLPKPQNNNAQIYKLPPKPSPLIPSKQNNSYDYPPQSLRENRANSGSRQNLAQR